MKLHILSILILKCFVCSNKLVIHTCSWLLNNCTEICVYAYYYYFFSIIVFDSLNSRALAIIASICMSHCIGSIECCNFSMISPSFSQSSTSQLRCGNSQVFIAFCWCVDPKLSHLPLWPANLCQVSTWLLPAWRVVDHCQYCPRVDCGRSSNGLLDTVTSQ